MYAYNTKELKVHETTAAYAWEFYQRHINLYHLAVTQEILAEWDEFCPFLDENDECTLHPYQY